MIDTSKMIFVFGSNEGGIHGGGAARFAYKERGARWGLSYGHFGQSFAIPTKGQLRHGDSVAIGETLPLERIKRYVEGFIAYAEGHPELTFQVTCIGCGLAGLKHCDIAPMFAGAPNNCLFDEKWKVWMSDFYPDGSPRKFWGEG